MSKSEFETLVLEKLDTISANVTSLDKKVDRLDDKLDTNVDELKQEMRLQGAYLNQAFDRISYYNTPDKKVKNF